MPLLDLFINCLLFGNGHGIASPAFDTRFFWLVDTLSPRRGPRSRAGQIYTWIGGFGAQIRSFEWIAPPAGTRRRLAGRDFVVFDTVRRGLRVDVAWRLVDFPRDIDQACAVLDDLQKRLGRNY